MPIPGNLQRRPFLAPIGLFALTAVAGLLVLAIAVWVLATTGSTTFIVVRHAEKSLEAVPDPPLSAAGRERAELLARMFGNTRIADHVDAIYVSAPLRNRMTAEPLALRLGITPSIAPQDDAKRLIRRMLREHSGGRILVIGHIDTIPAIVKALSGRNISPLADVDYGTIYIVTVPRIGRAATLSLSY